MKNYLEKGTIPLHQEEGILIHYEAKKYHHSPDRGEVKTKYQLVKRNGSILSPQVDEIIYDEEKKVLLYEDSILLDGGNSVTFRFMTDREGKQIGKIGNDYENGLDSSIILDGNTEDNFAKYEAYKKELKDRIQEEVDRKQQSFQKAQQIALKNLLK